MWNQIEQALEQSMQRVFEKIRWLGPNALSRTRLPAYVGETHVQFTFYHQRK